MMLHRALLASVVVIFLPGPAHGSGTLAGISVTRSFSPASAHPGEKVVVAIKVTASNLPAALRGFYVSEAVPDGLLASSLGATINGQSISLKTETIPAGALFTGTTTVRFILEEPPTLVPSNPFGPTATLEIRYAVTVPPSAANDYSFPGASWVGLIPSLGAGGDHYGFDDGGLLVVAGATPALSVNPNAISFSAEAGTSDGPPDQPVFAYNAGGGTLPTVTATTAYDGPRGWLTIDPSGSGNQQTLQNGVVLTGLGPGVYRARVVVSAPGVAQSPKSYEVVLKVRPYGSQPDAPVPGESGSSTPSDGDGPGATDGGCAYQQSAAVELSPCCLGLIFGFIMLLGSRLRRKS